MITALRLLLESPTLSRSFMKSLPLHYTDPFSDDFELPPSTNSFPEPLKSHNSSVDPTSILIVKRDSADALPISRNRASDDALVGPVVDHLPCNVTHSYVPNVMKVSVKREEKHDLQLPSSVERHEGNTPGNRSQDPCDPTQDTSDARSTFSQVSSKTSAARMALLIDKLEVVRTILHNIFKTKQLYKHLLSVSKVDAQVILDGFQLLLDNETFPDRVQLIAAMRSLSARTQLYPSRFFLQGPSPTAAAEPLASGSFADIYKVISRDEELCYKVIRVYQKSQVEHIAKVYAREAIIWGQLSHKNVLPFYGLIKFKSGSRISFVSRWASNGDLDDYLTEHPEANRVLLCSDTAAGVEYLHKNHIVHGDLKGSNVLIDSSGRACIGDFGISSVTDPKILKWTMQSTVASKGGTIRWQAPELLGSEETIKIAYNSKESDVFAWASICYEIFTGSHPFHESNSPGNIILSITRGKTPTRPKDDDAAWTKYGLSGSMWKLMEDCWNFKPSERPDMISVNLRLGFEQPVDFRPPGEWAKTAMRFRNAQDNVSEDLLPTLEELESLLSSVVYSGYKQTSVEQ